MLAIASRIEPAYTADPDTESGSGGRIVGWWKADTIVDPGDGNPVDTWPDESDTGADLTQTGGNRPTYRSAGSNDTDLPVVEFDGTDDYMSSAADSNLVILGDYTIIFMIRMDDVETAFQTLHMVSGSGSGSANNISHATQITTNRRIRSFHQRLNQSTQFYDTNGSSAEDIDTQKISTGWTVFALRRVDSTQTVTWWQNSEIYEVSSAYSNSATDGANGFMTFGADPNGSNPFDGQMAEMILFNEALSNGEIKAYFQYLNDKWLPKLLELDLFDGKATALEDPASVSGMTAQFSPESSKEFWTGAVLRTAEDLEEIDVWHSTASPDYYIGQDTNTRNPRLRSGFLNGFDVVEFNFDAVIAGAGNGWLQSDEGDRGGQLAGSGATLVDYLGSTGTDFTIFVVLASRLTPGKAFGFDENPNPRILNTGMVQIAADEYYWATQMSSSELEVRAQSPVVNTANDTPEDEVPWSILQIRADQGNIYIKVNEGIECETESANFVLSTGLFYMGTGTNFVQNETWAGFIAEFITYDVHLSRETCANIRAFLANKYDLY